MTASPSDEKSSRRRRLLIAGGSVLFFGLFYLYVLFGVDPELFYWKEKPFFLTTLSFLKGFLGRPGGLVQYVSSFLAQFTLYGWVGAGVFTFVAWAVCLGTAGVLKAMAGRRVHPAAACFPAVLLLTAHAAYGYQITFAVALAAALGFVTLYVRVAPRSSVLRMTVFAVLSVVLYYLAGSVVVVFGVLCALFELLKKRRILPGVFCLLWASAVPSGYALTALAVGFSEAYAPLMPFRPGGAPAVSLLLRLPVGLLALPVYLLLAAVAAWLLRRPVTLRQRLAAFGADARSTPEAALSAHQSRVRGAAWTLLSLAVFLLATALLTFWSFDADMKKRFQIECYAQHRMWDRLLLEVQRLPSRLYDGYVMTDVNRALYHTGRLPYEMFHYPQKKGPPAIRLLTGLGFLKHAEVMFELGQVNIAQQKFNEALESEGPLPMVLKRLAQINILKGKPEAARTYLVALRDSLLHRRWADRILRALEVDADLSDDEELQRIRAGMPAEDWGYGGLGGAGYDKMLLGLLRPDKRNRMAFEYLMAFYLLYNDFEQVAVNIGRLDDYDYAGIPRHYEEAILVGVTRNPSLRVDLGERRISDETVRRGQAFLRDAARYDNASEADEEARYQELAAKWGDSYFFYALFGFSEPRPGWMFFRAEAVTGATK